MRLELWRFLRNKMQIPLIEKIPTKHRLFGVSWSQGEFFFGSQKRVATVTDVKFLDEDLLVVAHRAAAMIYLIDVAQEKPRIIDRLRLWSRPRFKRYFHHPDLTAFDGRSLYISAYSDRYAEVLVSQRRLRLKGIKTAVGDHYHGCFVTDDSIYLGGVSTEKIVRVSKRDGSLSYVEVEMDEPRRIKTIGTDSGSFFLSLDRQDGSSTQSGCSGDACFSQYRMLDDQLLEVDSVSFERCQIDGAVSAHGLHFLSLQDSVEERGYIVTLKVTDKLEVVKKTPCEDFPHGLDVNETHLAYSCYSTSSVHVHPLSEFLPPEDLLVRDELSA